MIYLASPYSHPDPAVREYRYRAAVQAAAELMAKGEHVFSPIVHSHPLAVAAKLPTDWDYWDQYDEHMIEVCDRFMVLKLDGWQDSRGVAAERVIAINEGREIEYMDPPEVPADLEDRADAMVAARGPRYAQADDLQERLQDWEAERRKILTEECAGDEKHCVCVPVLRARIADLEQQLEDEMSEATSRLAAREPRKDGLLTDYALAMAALSDHGCDCGTDEPGTCLMCTCVRALRAERERARQLESERIGGEGQGPGATRFSWPDECAALRQEKKRLEFERDRMLGFLVSFVEIADREVDPLEYMGRMRALEGYARVQIRTYQPLIKQLQARGAEAIMEAVRAGLVPMTKLDPEAEQAVRENLWEMYDGLPRSLPAESRPCPLNCAEGEGCINNGGKS